MLSYNVINIVDYFLNVYADELSEETKKKVKKKRRKYEYPYRALQFCLFVCLFAWLAPQHLTGPIFCTGTFSGPLRQSESE